MQYCCVHKRYLQHVISSCGWDGALQCPSSSKNDNVSDFNDFVIDNGTACDIARRIVEDGTPPNLVIEMQREQKRRDRDNDHMSFTNYEEEDPIVETDSDEDILW